MVREIILHNNKGIALVDDEDYDWLNKYKWSITTGYAHTNIIINGKWTTRKMHRLIMKEPLNMHIDHIDGLKLNNQKNNLRIVTCQQNQMNQKIRKNTSSIYKGVSWHKLAKKWSAYIRKDNKLIYLGYFKNERDAAIEYNKVALKIFGEYACLNVVD